MSSNDTHADKDVKGYFQQRNLPWTNDIKAKLEEEGVDFVEDLKLLDKNFRKNLFQEEKPIIRKRADIMWNNLGGAASYQFTKVATSIPIGDSPSSPPAKKQKVGNKLPSQSIRQNGNKSVLAGFSGFSREVTKSAATKKLEREQRKKQPIIIDDGTCEPTTSSAVAATSSAVSANPNTAQGIIDALSSQPAVLLLGASDFRIDRCFLSETLTEPAGISERLCWGLKKMLPKGEQFKDLEDSKGHYELLGCSKSSSTASIRESFKKYAAAFKDLARTHHPDKTNDEAKLALFAEANTRYEKQKEAYEVLGTMNSDGSAYPDRVNYDREGEKLRDKFRASFEKTYPNETFDHRAQVINEEKVREAIFAKGHATRKINKDEGCMTKVTRLWVKDGQQDNRSRLSVHSAFEAGHLKSVIARAIRLDVYSTKKEVSIPVSYEELF